MKSQTDIKVKELKEKEQGGYKLTRDDYIAVSKNWLDDIKYKFKSRFRREKK